MEFNLQQTNEIIKDAEYMLIGIGNRFESCTENEEMIFKPLAEIGIHNTRELEQFFNNKEYSNRVYEMLINYYRKTNFMPIYNELYEMVKGKNYFIISMNTSEYILNSKLDRSKIVMPCGNEGLFQCEQACSKAVWSNADDIYSIIVNLPQILENYKLHGNQALESIFTTCKNCHQRAVLNVRSKVQSYVEEGYLPQWQAYMQWLARTLNRKLVLVELDVDFNLPSLIRWPFEKNAFINNKATLIRVNKQYPQLSEEIDAKGISVPMSGEQFLKLVN